MKTSQDKKKISELLTRRVVEIITVDGLKHKLDSGKPLRVKLGVDPTSPDIHLGHAVALSKLREFQELGHQVVLIIGDYTARVGDPSGKAKARPVPTAAEIETNAKTYLDQVGKILDLERLEVRRNSEWFAAMTFADVIKLTSQFTVARMIERDDFEKRLESGVDVHAHELLYPMMQAYDSIMVEADVEIGGTDQRFNLLAGRELQKKLGKPEQDVMLIGPLLVGTDGKQKMSKSLGNYIGVTDEPAQMFGKVMSIPDEAMWDYWTLVTDAPAAEIAALRVACERGEKNPRDAKAQLARAIITKFHSMVAADDAEREFEQIFCQGQKPEDIETLTVKDEILLIDVLMQASMATSKTDARRVIEQGGVKVGDQVVTDIAATITPTAQGVIIQKGKRYFVKVVKS